MTDVLSNLLNSGQVSRYFACSFGFKSLRAYDSGKEVGPAAHRSMTRWSTTSETVQSERLTNKAVGYIFGTGTRYVHFCGTIGCSMGLRRAVATPEPLSQSSCRPRWDRRRG